MSNTETGESIIFKGLTFHLYPCAIRATIRELITKNGGIFCGIRKPNIIYLAENKNFKKGVHVDFIYDSIKYKKLLDKSEYELPGYALKNKTNVVSIESTKLFSARSRYEPEEDEAILKYVTKHGQEFGQTGSVSGNTIWKQMERDKVTLHSWQSMRDRYLKHLQDKDIVLPFEPLSLLQQNGKELIFANNPSPSKKINNFFSNKNSLNKKRKALKGSDKKRKLFSANQPIFEGNCDEEENNISSFHSESIINEQIDNNATYNDQRNISKEKSSFSSLDEADLSQDCGKSSSIDGNANLKKTLTLSQVFPFPAESDIEDSFDAELIRNAAVESLEESQSETFLFDLPNDLDVCEARCEAVSDEMIIDEFCLENGLSEKEFIEFCKSL